MDNSMLNGPYALGWRHHEQYAIVPPVPIMQHPYEINRLIELYQKTPRPTYVVEIGSYQGGTLYYWLTLALPYTTVICIDPEITNDQIELWNSWKPENVTLHIIRGDAHTPEVLEQVKSLVPHIDWLYIDGLHTYDGVVQDFEMYGPLVQKGIIALHDIYQIGRLYPGHMGCQVWMLWDEIRRAGYITRELGVHKDWFGTGIVYKGGTLP